MAICPASGRIWPGICTTRRGGILSSSGPTLPKKILLVEDDAELRESTRRLLFAEGYAVTTAVHGLDALESVNREKPDAIVLDLAMPVMTGWEFLLIRQRNATLQRIPVLVLSGEAVRMPALLGIGLSLTKPVSPERLLGALEKLLAFSEGSEPFAHADEELERIPRASEPWSVDSLDLSTIRDSRGEIVATVFSPRKARRVVAAINAVRQISTEALEGGIVDRGLDCLSTIYRYRCDEPYRVQVDQTSGFENLLSAGDSLWGFLQNLRKPEPYPPA